MRSSFAGGVAAALFVASASLAREPETAALGWVRLSGAESCVSAHELAKDIEARIGRRVLVSASRADLLIEAHVAPLQPTGFSAKIRTTRSDGSLVGVRGLSSEKPNCNELGEKAVLVIALTIDPDAKLKPAGAPAPAPAPAPAEATPTPTPKTKPEVKVVVRRERVLVPVAEKKTEPWTGEGRLALSASFGLLPVVTPGLLAAANLTPPGFPAIEVSGGAWLEREADVEGGGARFTLLSAGLALCPSTAVGPFRGHFCAGLTAGSMRARGFGFDETEDQAEPLVLVTGGARLSLPLGDAFFTSVGLRLEGAVVRPRFFFQQANGQEIDVHRVPPVGASTELGFGFLFSS